MKEKTKKKFNRRENVERNSILRAGDGLRVR